MNPVLAAVIVCVIPFSVALASFLSSRSEKLFNQSRKTYGELYSLSEECFTGFDCIKAFGLENERIESYSKLCTRFSKEAKKAAWLPLYHRK